MACSREGESARAQRVALSFLVILILRYRYSRLCQCLNEPDLSLETVGRIILFTNRTTLRVHSLRISSCIAPSTRPRLRRESGTDPHLRQDLATTLKSQWILLGNPLRHLGILFPRPRHDHHLANVPLSSYLGSSLDMFVFLFDHRGSTKSLY